jgi:1,4-dihydroxy-2-naphthoate octaprenyltransferase
VEIEMKKTKLIMFAIIGLTITFGAGIAVYSTMSEIKPIEYIIYAAVGLIVIFGLVRVVKNLKDEKKGLTTEDELSKRIQEKVAAKSFYASYYIWTMIIVFTVDRQISSEILLGIGLVGISLVYIGIWLYHNNKGLEDENPN